ncbi:MAG TPA: helix-turn-helix transcriptional regulator [Solimonas sp.]|nr:helix-turn-helix transcriptional regulator [Solimonas sp.]
MNVESGEVGALRFRSGSCLARVTALLRAEPLTRRECEVLEWMAQGLTRRDLARTLGVSVNTVKYHLKNIYSKMGVEGRGQAVVSWRASR